MEKTGRYLVVIESGPARIGRLFDEAHELLAEFDAGSEEVAGLTREVQAYRIADDPEWNRALAGHSRAERAAAEVYHLS